MRGRDLLGTGALCAFVKCNMNRKFKAPEESARVAEAMEQRDLETYRHVALLLRKGLSVFRVAETLRLLPSSVLAVSWREGIDARLSGSSQRRGETLALSNVSG